MKKNVSITLILLLIPLVILSHVSWSTTENGLLFNVDGRDVDFAGIIKDKWRLATKTCRSVTELENSDPRLKEIKALVQTYSPPDSIHVKSLYAWTTGSWAVAEVEFETLLPAVVTIKNLDKKMVIVDDAIWSGLTTPWVSGPFIRTYLGRGTSQVPHVLLDCFELQTKSFK